MQSWVVVAITSAASLLASSGFWAYVMKKDATKTATARLVLGIAYGKIVQLGLAYIEQGWVSKDEYEEFRKYLYEPYKEVGGNGVADRIMTEVSALPLRSPAKYSEIKREKEPT